jgi:hypothetical protein
MGLHLQHCCFVALSKFVSTFRVAANTVSGGSYKVREFNRSFGTRFGKRETRFAWSTVLIPLVATNFAIYKRIHLRVDERTQIVKVLHNSTRERSGS